MGWVHHWKEVWKVNYKGKRVGKEESILTQKTWSKAKEKENHNW